ncbi:MAG: alkaline phosphatase family protein [Flavobacteriales bacterium]|nr:MAG: alkaline phosphatase family protein [Flavobacteriales bacterium]
MLKKIGFSAIVLSSLFQVKAQEKPKLVVGLVIDQMRWDYLHRFENKFQKGGFKRLLNQGFSLNNVMINYVPSVTALGHTSVYTGSVPSIHGIAGNNWLDPKTGKGVYCTTDTSVKGIGSSSERVGAHSPRNLWSTTITDQLGMATNFQSKVVGVSLKDRASILPAGHHPTGAFWFDGKTGNFVTSSYYMDKLPKWLNTFNAQKRGAKLVKNGWSTLLPIEEYTESTADNQPWEGLLGSAKTPTFPYTHLAEDYAKKKKIIKQTPFGNTLTLELADTVVDAYQMGQDEITDFLAINLASTDYVGHLTGVNSIEVEDTYLRLDRDLASFFKSLDKKVGKGNYLVFVTADHGAAHAVGYMKEHQMPTGFFDKDLKDELKTALRTKFGTDDLIAGVMNYQVYLNKKTITQRGLDMNEVKTFIIDFLKDWDTILYAVDLQKVSESSIPEPIKTKIINGYNWKRSGDIQVIAKDGMLPSYAKKGTTHSVWNSYDAHIPLIFMGTGIQQGESSKAHYITDIAPTLAQLLQIENPSGTVGQPIIEVVD